MHLFEKYSPNDHKILLAYWNMINNCDNDLQHDFITLEEFLLWHHHKDSPEFD